jgi:hypothetical protein
MHAWCRFIARQCGRRVRGSGARPCNYSSACSRNNIATLLGISTLHLAAALQDNGGGRLIITELEPSKALRAREHLSTAGLLDW